MVEAPEVSALRQQSHRAHHYSTGPERCFSPDSRGRFRFTVDGARVCVSAATLWREAKGWEPVKAGRPSNIDNATYAWILELRDKGMSMPAIARTVGSQKDAVRKVLSVAKRVPK